MYSLEKFEYYGPSIYAYMYVEYKLNEKLNNDRYEQYFSVCWYCILSALCDNCSMTSGFIVHLDACIIFFNLKHTI